jgi:hypothetical protein
LRIVFGTIGLALFAGAIAAFNSDELREKNGLKPFYGLLCLSVPCLGFGFFGGKIARYLEKKEEEKKKEAAANDDPMIKEVEEG